MILHFYFFGGKKGTWEGWKSIFFWYILLLNVYTNLNESHIFLEGWVSVWSLILCADLQDRMCQSNSKSLLCMFAVHAVCEVLPMPLNLKSREASGVFISAWLLARDLNRKENYKRKLVWTRRASVHNSY